MAVAALKASRAYGGGAYGGVCDSADNKQHRSTKWAQRCVCVCGWWRGLHWGRHCHTLSMLHSTHRCHPQGMTLRLGAHPVAAASAVGAWMESSTPRPGCLLQTPPRRTRGRPADQGRGEVTTPRWLARGETRILTNIAVHSVRFTKAMGRLGRGEGTRIDIQRLPCMRKPCTAFHSTPLCWHASGATPAHCCLHTPHLNAGCENADVVPSKEHSVLSAGWLQAGPYPVLKHSQGQSGSTHARTVAAHTQT